MGIRKYKYYFKKPKSEIVKDVLYWLLVSGAVCISATSPYFLVNLVKNIKKFKKYPPRKLSSTFYQLKKQGYVRIVKRKNQFYVHLTPEGKKKAGWFQINDLKIKKPKKWDGKWRIVIFDISQLKKFLRELFRGKLKELGFYPLQKSVWVCPYDCQAEIELLREFFGLSVDEVRLVVAEKIENEKDLKRIFKL